MRPSFANGVVLVQLAAALALSSVCPHARAGDKVRDRVVEPDAEQLFQEGKKLLSAGDYARACPLLAKSFELDPGTGTLLALAICHEREGKLATAFREYGDVITRARRDGRSDRADAAAAAMRQLEPALPRITVEVPDDVAGLKGLSIRRNGEPVTKDLFGTGVPVDPGTYRIEATAEGREPFVSDVTIDGASDRKAVRIALRERTTDAEGNAQPQVIADVPPPASPAKKVATVVAFGAAGVGLAAGVTFGVLALDARGDIDRACPDRQCPASERDALGRARTFADLATAGFVLAGIGAASGAILILLTPQAKSPAASGTTTSRSTSAYVGPGSIGIQGTF
jgi:hypothetical protein